MVMASFHSFNSFLHVHPFLRGIQLLALALSTFGTCGWRDLGREGNFVFVASVWDAMVGCRGWRISYVWRKICLCGRYGCEIALLYLLRSWCVTGVSFSNYGGLLCGLLGRELRCFFP